MLDQLHSPQSVAKMIAALPCRVQLPASLQERFELTGVAPATPDDRRRNPRLRCRSANNRAALQRQATFPSLECDHSWTAIYLADMSRGGMQLIASEQIYPGEQLRLLLLNGAAFDVEAVRCRRMGDACYSVGVRTLGQLFAGE